MTAPNISPTTEKPCPQTAVYPLFAQTLSRAEKAWRVMKLDDEVDPEKSSKNIYNDNGFLSYEDQWQFFAGRIDSKEQQWSRANFERFKTDFGFLKSFTSLDTNKNGAIDFQEFYLTLGTRIIGKGEPCLAWFEGRAGTDKATFLKLFSQEEKPLSYGFSAGDYTRFLSSAPVRDKDYAQLVDAFVAEVMAGRSALDEGDFGTMMARYRVWLKGFTIADRAFSGRQDGIVTEQELRLMFGDVSGSATLGNEGEGFDDFIQQLLTQYKTEMNEAWEKISQEALRDRTSSTRSALANMFSPASTFEQSIATAKDAMEKKLVNIVTQLDHPQAALIWSQALETYLAPLLPNYVN